MKKNKGFVGLLWTAALYFVIIPGLTSVVVLALAGSATLLETIRISRPAQEDVLRKYADKYITINTVMSSIILLFILGVVFGAICEGN